MAMRSLLAAAVLIALAATVTSLAGARSGSETAQPGGNGMIAFWRGAATADGKTIGLHVVNPNGTGVQPVGPTDDRVGIAEPEWSPDGNEIVFVRDKALWRMQADGTGLTRLLPNEQYIRDPTWSPDGQRIAYVSYAMSPTNAAGGAIKVTDRNGNVSVTVFQENCQGTSGAIGSDLSWGANDLLAFEAVTCSEPADWWLLTMDSNGSDSKRLRRTRASAKVKVEPLVPKSLDWSPDGTRLLLVGESDNATYECGGLSPGYTPTDVYLLDPNNPGTQVNLTNTPGKFTVRELTAAWSPDGRQIVLSGIRQECVSGRETAGRPELYTMPASGGPLTQLTDDGKPGQEGGSNDDWPSWQPCIQGKTVRCVSTGATNPAKPQAPGRVSVGLLCGTVRAELDLSYYGEEGYGVGDTVCSLLVPNPVVMKPFRTALQRAGVAVDPEGFRVVMTAVVLQAAAALPGYLLRKFLDGLLPNWRTISETALKTLVKTALTRIEPLFKPFFLIQTAADLFVKELLVPVTEVLTGIVKAKALYVGLVKYRACTQLTFGFGDLERGRVLGPTVHGAGKPLPWATNTNNFATLVRSDNTYLALPLECTASGAVARASSERSARRIFSSYATALVTVTP